LLDALGADYFRKRAMPLLLIPACMTCNNNMGTSHVYHEGRIVHMDRMFRRQVQILDRVLVNFYVTGNDTQ
jgi:hypothetical protein